MENRASKPNSYSNDWITPVDRFNNIKKQFNFTLDVCATHKNSKCSSFITKDEDALVLSWDVMPGSFWWCNPPFNQIRQFVEKALNELRLGNEGIMLLPPNIDTKWFHELILKEKLPILFLPSRIQFLSPTDQKKKANTKGSMLVGFFEGCNEEYLTSLTVEGAPWLVQK